MTGKIGPPSNAAISLFIADCMIDSGAIRPHPHRDSISCPHDPIPATSNDMTKIRIGRVWIQKYVLSFRNIEDEEPTNREGQGPTKAETELSHRNWNRQNIIHSVFYFVRGKQAMGYFWIYDAYL